MSPGLKGRLVTARRTAVVVGAVTLLGLLTVDAIKAIESYRLIYPETTLEQQATEFLAQSGQQRAQDLPLSGIEKFLRSTEDPVEAQERLVRQLERLTSCEFIIKKYATVNEKTVMHIPSNAKTYFTASPCYFSDPSVRPNIRDVVIDEIHVRRVIFQSLAMAALTAVVTFIALSLLVYPHLGWRRLSISAAPLLGISIGAIRWLTKEDLSSAIVVATLGTVLFGPLILIGRELYLWVARGFMTEKERPKV